jgi:hypothetical protein
MHTPQGSGWTAAGHVIAHPPSSPLGIRAWPPGAGVWPLAGRRSWRRVHAEGDRQGARQAGRRRLRLVGAVSGRGLGRPPAGGAVGSGSSALLLRLHLRADASGLPGCARTVPSAMSRFKVSKFRHTEARPPRREVSPARGPRTLSPGPGRLRSLPPLRRPGSGPRGPPSPPSLLLPGAPFWPQPRRLG